MPQSRAFRGQTCPQAAPLLEVLSPMPDKPRHSVQCLDFKADCSAEKSGIPAKAARNARVARLFAGFFTKLSTEVVNGAGRRKCDVERPAIDRHRPPMNG